MQRNNQEERCERLSSAQQHASECEGLSALRDILDWCMDAGPIWFVAARFLGRLPWRDPRAEKKKTTWRRSPVEVLGSDRN